MGKIIEINGEFFVEFYGNGLLFRKKAGGSLPEARAALARIEDSLRVSAPEIAPGSATCALFFDRYTAYAAQAHPMRTARRLISAAAHCRQFLCEDLGASALLREVTPRVIEEYRQRLIMSIAGRPVLINFTLYLLRDIFQHAVGLGWLNDNPCVHTRPVPEPERRRPSTYSEGELIEMREGLSSGQDLILALHLYAGLTPAEIAALRWPDIDWEQRELAVARCRNGSATIRRMPLDVRLYDALRERRDDQDGDVPPFVAVPLPAAINPYRLRNTFIRDVLGRGVPLTRLNRLLGIDDVARLFRYRAFLPANGEAGGAG